MKHVIHFNFKQLWLLCMLIPMIGFSQTKNVVSSERYFPKIDKIQEFEKALASHAQKFHKGDTQWRVFSIISGPDAGGYHITEGPKSWASEDDRGDLGPDHMNDFHKNVAIYLTDRYAASFAVFQDSLSTVSLGDFSDKISITHIYPKLGHYRDVVLMTKRVKKTWAALGISIAVYFNEDSGRSEIAFVERNKQGFKEKEEGSRKPFKTTHDAENGAGMFDQHLKDIETHIDSAWSEMLIFRKDLSSK